jgi:hypothetical protein
VIPAQHCSKPAQDIALTPAKLETSKWFNTCGLTHTSVLFSDELAPDFYLKKSLAANTKGVFDLRSPKSDGNFFFLWEGVATFMCIGYRFKSSFSKLKTSH